MDELEKLFDELGIDKKEREKIEKFVSVLTIGHERIENAIREMEEEFTKLGNGGPDNILAELVIDIADLLIRCYDEPLNEIPYIVETITDHINDCMEEKHNI